MRYATLAHAGHPEPSATVIRRDVWASWGGLILLLLACNAIPVAAAVLLDRAPATDLAMPWWTPRMEVLAVAGVVTYSAMAIATWMVVRQQLTVMTRWATAPFEVQLALSGLWLVVLGGLREPTPAVALIGAQVLALVVAVPRYSTLSRSAGRVLAAVLVAATAALVWTALVVMLNPPELPPALIEALW